MSVVAELADVRKTYPGGAEALKGVDLAVSEGESIGLIGPNGAGKTTLVRLLLGLLKATSGRVTLFGRDAYTLPIERKCDISFVPEEAGVYENLTVEENLLFWAKLYAVRPSRVDQALATWDLREKRRALVRTLSAGMRRRLGIARALIHEAAFCVMDEPTSSLDPEARRAVADLLREFGRDRALLVSSHDLFDIERTCSRVALLRRGAIAAQGSMRALEEQLGVERRTAIRFSGKLPEALERELIDGDAVRRTAGDELSIVGERIAARDAVRLLVKHGIDIERVEERRVSLEDVYLHIVKEDEAE